MKISVEKGMTWRRVINELTELIYEAESCFAGKFVQDTGIIILVYLIDPAEALAAEPFDQDKPVRCFFKKRILPAITTLTSDPDEINYMLVWLLNNLAAHLRENYVEIIRHAETAAKE